MYAVWTDRLHEGMILLYAASILLYFLDFLHQNRKANKAAFRFLSVVWALQTVIFILYMAHTRRSPVLTLSEGLYFYAWALLTLSLALNRLLRVDFTVFFTNVIGFFIMTVHAFAPEKVSQGAGRMVSELLFMHITMTLIAYVLFSLSFVFSVLYLLQYKWLKEKKWSHRIWRLNDLAKLERLSKWMNAIAVPVLLLGLILGLWWAYLRLPAIHWLDPKIVGSFVVLLVYSFLLYAGERRRMFGKTLAYWNMAAFLIILINFFLITGLSDFHLYY
ncbi:MULTISPECIES: cytochrome c biogenesis protein CcsA [Heyndrickxia]|uniref:cytochrome c biogenesis protein CcsA n=1 Tax=Heyndrickxia TaxID=2837504 RepID=UPI002DBB29C1|nr:cytochrome c biogenesis protein CcsA [Weizmannia sp. CD-2023]MEC2303818.1 cytochrome c biogenesis protein CcsA [Weizmannia sp. CD-2023]MEC2340779.1 cytochrome c biogenesis protein CcsA [Weizmannia sp. CD-2023]